jgi:hypothetical protein
MYVMVFMDFYLLTAPPPAHHSRHRIDEQRHGHRPTDLVLQVHGVVAFFHARNKIRFHEDCQEQIEPKDQRERLVRNNGPSTGGEPSARH